MTKKIRRFVHQGLVRNTDEFLITSEGLWHKEVHDFRLNYCLPDVLCSMGNTQLAKIEKFKSRRQLILDQYLDAFVDLPHVIVPTRKKFVELMWHLFPIRVRAEIRREVFVMLRNAGLGVQVNYLPAYWHPVFKKDANFFGHQPNTETYYSEEKPLP